MSLSSKAGARAVIAAATLAAMVGFTVGVGEAPAAGHRNAYLVCDEASDPNYPAMRIAPHSCTLGLGASYYDAQPVPGHPTPRAVVLQRLKWRHWGHRTVKGHGQACDVYSGRCERVRVILSRPERVMPAGGRVIYQLIRVRHFPPNARPFTDWYQPGTDY